MSKGGSTDSTVVQTSLPDYVEKDMKNLIKRATTESQREYTAYKPDRVADLSKTTENYQAGVGELYRDASNSPNYAAMAEKNAGGISGLANKAAQAYEFDPTQFSERNRFSETGTSGFNAGPASRFTEGNIRDQGTFTGDTASAYMSPYIQNVMAQQRDAARLEFDRSKGARDAEAVSAGAFGGSRQAIQEGMAQEDLQRRMDSINATGLQSAYDRAGDLFSADRSAALAVDTTRAGELGRVQSGSQTENARLDALGYEDLARRQGISVDEAARVQAAKAGEDERLDAIRLQRDLEFQGMTADERNRAAAAGIAGLTSANQGLTMAQSMDSERLGNEADALQIFGDMGQQKDARAQAEADIAYEDFVRQRDYNKEQLNYLSSILRGVPVNPNVETTRMGSTNPFQQLVGGGMGIAGLMGMS
jgi:hypothetical protein